MTRRDRPTAEARPREPGAPAAVLAEPYVLALQRAAGNQAVARLVARQPKPDRSESAPRAGGWNEKAQAVGGSHRFPVTGVTRGNQTLDKQGGTPERAAGSAVVVVPDGADLAKPFEVLLLFHGIGIGYRERTTTAPMDAGGPGTVRDVEDDLIPQQLAHGGRNIVGVLAQGLMYGANRFDIADPGAYVEEVLKLAAPQIKQELPGAHAPDAPKPLRTIFAGHSGGGIVAVQEAATGTPKAAPADKAQWLARPRLFVFDGIHNSDQRDEVLGVVRRWVREDVAFLAGQADPVALLNDRRLKFRSTFSTGGWKGYTGWNVGLDWDEPVIKDGKPVLDENQKPKVVHRSVKPEASLRALIAGLIEADAAKAKPGVIAKLKEQYVVEGPLQAEHERTMGVGAPPESRKEKRDPAPGGLTAPADKGVPAYSGGGQLEKALERLSDDTKIGRVARRRWTEQQIEDSRRAATAQAEVHDADRHGRPTAESRARQAMEDELGGRTAVDAWFAGHVPNATFMGYEIAGNRGSASPGVHQRMLALLQRAEARLVDQGMPRAGEAAPATPADPQLAAFRISDVSGLREPSPPTDMTSGVSMHCYGMAVDFNVAGDPFVRHSGAQMAGRAMLLVEGKDYILDGAAGHGTPSEAWDSLHAGSEALKTYLTLSVEQIREKLTEHPNAAAKGDAAWWAEQIRLDRTDADRRKNWVGGSPAAGFMDLPKAFVTILADAGLTWGGTYAGGKDIMHFDGRDDFRAQRHR